MAWRRALLLVLLGIWISLGPGAAADEPILEQRVELCIITYVPSEDFSRIDVVADETLTDEAMAELLDEVDLDDDSIITADEVDQYEAQSVRVEYDFQALGVLKITMDDIAPTAVHFRKELRGFEGAVDSDQTRLVSEHRRYEFYGVAQASAHVMEGGLYTQGEPRNVAVEEFVVVEAPLGWYIRQVNDTKYGAQRVELPSFDTRSSFTVHFTDELPQPEDGAYIPAAGMGVVALLVALTGALRKAPPLCRL